MVHQIADENGTLKHIILSVMDNSDTSQLNSTVFNLPHGSFRINSLGELVSTGTNLGGSIDGDPSSHHHNQASPIAQPISSATTTANRLPQQQTAIYFANYDGCPIASYDATPTNIINSGSSNSQLPVLESPPQQDKIPNSNDRDTSVMTNTAIDKSNSNNNSQNSGLSVLEKDKSNSEMSNNKQQKLTSAVQLSKNDTLDDTVKLSGSEKNSPRQKQVSATAPDSTQTTAPVPSDDNLVVVNKLVANEQQLDACGDTLDVNLAEQQVVGCVPPSINDSAAAYHQVIGSAELEPTIITTGTVPTQILSAVDEQLYGYPSCCCCCYCDPQEAAAAAAVAVGGHHQPSITGTMLGQQDIIMMAPEHSAPVAGAAGPNSGTGRTSGCGSVNNMTTTNGIMTFHQPNSMMTTIQGGVGMPMSLTSGSLVSSQALQVHPLTGQNGLVPIPSSGHFPEVGGSTGPKGHKGPRGSNNSYKHKVHSGTSGGVQQSSDRHQTSYSGHYTSQSYNNIVSGQSYRQDSGSPSSYKSSQTLLSHQGAMMAAAASAAATGGYSPVYPNYNQVQTPHQQATMANVVSSGKQSTNHGAPTPSSGHQQQAIQSTATYRSIESECHLQRNSRSDQQMTNHMSSIYSGNTASGFRAQHNDNIKRQQQIVGGDKSSNRYNSNVRVITSNHVLTGSTGTNSNQHHQANNSNNSSISGSVSPLRPGARLKGSTNSQHHLSQHNQSTPPNGIRTSSNLYYGNIPNVMHEFGKENVVLANQNQQNHGSKMSTKNIYAANQDHGQVVSSATSKFINNVSSASPNSGYYQHKSSSWQQSYGHPRSANLAKNSSSGSLFDDSGSTSEQNISFGKKQPNQNDKSSEALEIKKTIGSGSEVVGGEPLHSEESPMPRSSRGKQKKCQKESTKQSNDTSNQQKRQHSSDNVGKSLRSQRPRSTNDSNRKEAEQSNVDHQDKTKAQQKRANRLDNNKQSQVASSKPVANEQIVLNESETFKEASGTEKDIHCVEKDSPKIEREGFSNNIDQVESNIIQESSSTSPVKLASACQDLTKLSDNVEASQPTKSKDKHRETVGKTVLTSSRSNQSLKGESPARKKSKTSQSSPKNVPSLKDDSPERIVKSSGQHEKQKISESIEDEEILIVSREDSPTASGKTASKLTLAMSMRTSLSENNIQLLDIASLSAAKSTQTTPQKQITLPPPTTVVAEDNQASKGLICPSEQTKKKTDSKRRSLTGKTEQQFRLNSLPQVRLLNMSCVSVTSSSVCLRWSYIPSLAEKYKIHYHHHHGTKNHASSYDHFVVESSSSKNVETGTLISPKIVYQGCAMTCRINHLTSDKIYHFRIRRTALVSAEDGEHLAVSDILSVTLPSVQQQQSSSNNSKKSQNSGHKSSSNHNENQSTISGESTSTSSSVANSSSFPSRVNTSSQINTHHNNNNKSSSLHHHPIKFSNLVRQCRNRFVSTLGNLVQNSLSSYSDTKFAGLLLVLFTVFAMLLAIFIHLYIVAPVNE